MYQVLKIYGFATIVAASILDKPRSVNVALETSLLFEPKDNDHHLKLIYTVRRILDNIENALQQSQKVHFRSQFQKPKRILTNFVSNLTKTIIHLHEIDVQIFFSQLNYEMKSHFYKGSVFLEMIYDPRLQNYIRYKLKTWANAHPKWMKKKLKKYAGTKNVVMDTIKKLDCFFNSTNEIKMKTLLVKLRKSGRIPDVIKEGIEYFIFEHYDKMDSNDRAKVASEINKLANLTKTRYKKVDKEFELTFRKSPNVASEKKIDGVLGAFVAKGMDTEDDDSIEALDEKFSDEDLNMDKHLHKNIKSNARRYNYDRNITSEGNKGNNDETLKITRKDIRQHNEHDVNRNGDASDKENRERNEDAISNGSKEKHETLVKENKQKDENYINEFLDKISSKEQSKHAISKDSSEEDSESVYTESKDRYEREKKQKT